MSEIVAPNRSDALVEQQRTGTFRLMNWIEAVTSRISAIFARSMRTSRAVTSSDTLAVSDAGIYADASAGNVVIAMPSPSACSGCEFFYEKTDSSANYVQMTGTIGGTVNPKISIQHNNLSFRSDGSAWHWA